MLILLFEITLLTRMYKKLQQVYVHKIAIQGRFFVKVAKDLFNTGLLVDLSEYKEY